MPVFQTKFRSIFNQLVTPVLFICISHWGYAQYSETIESGRPGQAIGSHVIGTKIFQVQSGYTVAGSTDATLESSDINTVLRFGLSEYFEVNGAVTYGWVGHGGDNLRKGWSQTEIGVRADIHEAEGIEPSIGFQYRMKFPNDFSIRDNTSSIITLVTQQHFGKIGFTTNWGIDWVGQFADELGFYVLNLSTGLGAKTGVFIEHYGFFSGGEWLGKFDGGIAYLVTNDLQLDFFAGGGSLGYIDDGSVFVSAGISWRTARKNK